MGRPQHDGPGSVPGAGPGSVPGPGPGSGPGSGIRNSSGSASGSSSGPRNGTGSGPARRPRLPRSSRKSEIAFKLLFSWPAGVLIAVILTLLFWGLMKPAVPESAEAATSVYDRGLVNPEVPYQTILKEHARPWNRTNHRHVTGMVLAYVTPWNSKGFDNAKRFRSKFTHVSPVWYELRRGNFKSQLDLVGGHDVDQEWISEVRKNGSPRILPRFVLRGMALDRMLTESDEKQRAIDLIVSECQERRFDGAVFEAWSSWHASRLLEVPELRLKAVEFVQALGSILHSTAVGGAHDRRNMEFVFVIPPPNSRNADPRMISTDDLLDLGSYVDGFSLMTYDFSSPYSPGPNAPIRWVEACLRALLPETHIRRKPDYVKAVSRKFENYDSAGRRFENFDSGRELKSLWAKDPEKDVVGKVLLGINFYGNDYIRPQGGNTIVGHQFTDLLATVKPKLIWDKESKEHYFDYELSGVKHTVFYPSLLSLAFRLEEADLWGTGLSIWEIGQGLDYFFDLF